ncbi:hypothetical protein CEK26_008391 [Fusarium fujikuroi]|nr:hypothetical protein CEK27_008408 [Fusarium fujikuroi]QGI95322.1 hypothetical protein CEK26_008391 [Fusarium fujikuroi]
MDSFSSSQEPRGSANVSPQAAQQQSSNLATLGQQRHQTTNPFWQNWAGDDPWNPLAFGAPNDGQTRSQLIGSANFQTSYQDYRSKPLLSECDTNPEDSAYGSRLTHSIGNPSAYGEDMDPDVQNLEPQNSDAQLVNRNLETLQLQCQPASNDAHLYQDQWVRPYPPASVATAPVGGERRWICGECQKRCRTRSELSPVPSQDLEGVGGSAMAYLQAQEQLPGLAHPSTILSFRVPYGERRASQSQSGTNNPPRGPPSLSFDRDASSLATVREGDENFVHPDIIHGRSALPSNQWPVSASEEDAPGDDVTASEAEQPDDDALETMDGVQQGEGTTTDVSRNSGDSGSQQVDVRMVDADEAQRTPKAIPPHEKESKTPSDVSPESAYVDLLDKIPKELIASYLKKRFADLGEEASKLDTVNSKSQSHPHKCQDCDKAFPRLCELKKHQKRHSKPYGCTFADCKKTFGSKNDWKRHESIQHYQLETWICDCVKPDSAEPCGKVCYRRESFRNHLSKEHEITDTSKLEEKVEGCRKGRHCDAHFWCGFCQETVEIKETDNTWAKRCDHIDDHFSGRRVPQRDISEWIHEKDHRVVPSAPQVDESESSSGSSPCDPISPQSSVSTENSGEDRRGRKKDMYMWTCALSNLAAIHTRAMMALIRGGRHQEETSCIKLSQASHQRQLAGGLTIELYFALLCFALLCFAHPWPNHSRAQTQFVLYRPTNIQRPIAIAIAIASPLRLQGMLRLTHTGTPDSVNPEDFTCQIDPLLQHMAPYPSHEGTYCGTNSMQRYLQEPQSSYLIASSHVDIPGTQYTGIYPNMGGPAHQNSQVRPGSPMSYQPSSAASGPHSPNWTDNDAHVSTLGPSTPSDVAVLSPNIVGSGSLSPSVSLYGLSSGPQGCVDPAIIEPSQPFSGIREEQEINAFTLDMNAEFDGATSNSIYQGDGSSSPSTFDPLPQELYPQPDTKTAYPDPDDTDLDVNLENEAETIHGDDGDDEYRPNCRTKSPRNAKGGSRRARTRRLSSSTNASRGKVTKSRSIAHGTPARKLLSSCENMLCIHCQKVFNDDVSLQKHINAMHTRPFICVFHFAGCNHAFANKNEWKRHVSAQHLNLHYWLCTTGACGYPSTPLKGVLGTATHCRVFKRKDLYTQHIRRMHAPEEVAKADKKNKTFPPEWSAQEKKLQEEAFRQRCKLPDYMDCPAKGCTTVFNNGHKTWDDRMEHVAVHLERASKNEEPHVVFGGTNDEALTEWASHPNVRVIVSTSGGWETFQPLKAAKTELSRLTSVHDEGLDEDAEGEEC